MTVDMVAFRAERKKGLGASDAWDCAFNPLKVYLDKTGQLPEQHNDEMDMGLMLEDVVARLYERRTGHPLVKPSRPYQRIGYPFMTSNPDRIGMYGEPVELKTAGDLTGWGAPDTDEIPEEYILQVQQQMACLNARQAHVAALIRLADFRVYTVPRNDALIERLTTIEGDLWNRIINRYPPAPDWSHPETPKLVALLHRPCDGVMIDLDCRNLLDDYEQLGADISRDTKAREEIKARIVEAMGNASQATLPDGRVIKRKMSHVPASMHAAHTKTSFTISHPKQQRSKPR